MDDCFSCLHSAPWRGCRGQPGRECHVLVPLLFIGIIHFSFSSSLATEAKPKRGFRDQREVMFWCHQSVIAGHLVQMSLICPEPGRWWGSWQKQVGVSRRDHTLPAGPTVREGPGRRSWGPGESQGETTSFHDDCLFLQQGEISTALDANANLILNANLGTITAYVPAFKA